MGLFAEGIPFLEKIAQPLGMYGYEIGAILSVLLVSAICGLVGALVVGNRMAFFSDAMSHCAFAGVALGLVVAMIMGIYPRSEEMQWLVPLIMVLFGALVGVGIAFVREKTGLASDTVIGVFFAGSIGFGAMLLTALQERRAFDPEKFLFGSPNFVRPLDLIFLLGVLVLTKVVLFWRYNHFLLASFNPSLARSRNVALRLNNYLFIVLLALIVNFSICAVGVLLINAMLIVPAATATNLSRNLRQMFWVTLGLSLVTGVVGLELSRSIKVRFGPGEPLRFGPSGTIICLSVMAFFVSMIVPVIRRRFSNLAPPPRREFGRSA